MFPVLGEIAVITGAVIIVKPEVVVALFAKPPIVAYAAIVEVVLFVKGAV